MTTIQDQSARPTDGRQARRPCQVRPSPSATRRCSTPSACTSRSRSVVEVVTDSGAYGLGESYGDLRTCGGLERAAAELVGLDVFDLPALRRWVLAALAADDGQGGTA